MSKGFVEEGKRTARGQPPAHIEWNALDLGDGTFAMERPTSVDQSKRINQEDIPYTHAFVRKQNKFYCQLCTMWFDRRSVGYKVPSHRIVDLQKKWNCHRTGRRYNNASYLYSFVDVCLFCSQFFQSTDKKVKEGLAEADEIFSVPSGTRIDAMHIERRDMAALQKAYQCSMVDEKGPEYVISPPYNQGGCRTRREVDPWWEVDLGRTQSVHSVSFTTTVALQQKMHVFVILLRGPIGFENPFLDDVLKMACDWHEFVFEESPEVVEESRVWTLPEKVFGGAVRVQIRGKHVLRLSRCQVFQGDDLPPEQLQVDFSKPSEGFEAEPIGLDEMMRITSFASHPIKIFDDLRKDSQANENETLHISDAKEKQIQTIKRVNILNTQYQARKARIEWWLERSRDSANFFTIDELMCFRDILFLPICNGPKNAGAKRANKFIIPTHDLRGNSLMQHYPRCDFADLIKHIKQIAEWIQNRQHTRDINAFLVAPEKFDPLYHCDNDLFERLRKVLVFLEETWNGSGRKWMVRAPAPAGDIVSPARGKRATLLGQSGGGGPVVSDSAIEPQVVDGASWSQVVMTMHLLCLNDVENIPEYVFAIDEGLEMLFPLDHDNSDGDDSDAGSVDIESQSLSSSVISEKRFNRSKDVKARTLGSPLRRALSPPPADVTIGRMVNIENRNDTRTRSSKLAPGVARKDPNLRPSSPNNFACTAPVNLIPISAVSGAVGGRRLASTMPIGMSQLVQLSLLSAQDSFQKGSAVEADQVSEVSQKSRSKNLKKSKRLNVPHLKNGVPSLLQSTKDPRMPNLNFEHAQYKLNRLQKSSKFDRVFPKCLDKDFPVESPLARFQLETREKKPSRSDNSSQANLPTAEKVGRDDPVGAAPLGGGADFAPSDGSMSWDGDMFNRSMTISEGNSPNHSFDDRDNVDRNDSFFLPSRAQSAQKTSKHKKAQVLKYTRTCMLCTQSFPKKAVENKIMMKHIITVRTALDPALGSKFAAHLMQGLSPFNLVFVCEFCSQFFDPDMRDGVCMPEVQRSESAVERQDIFAKKSSQGLDTFYDGRYPGSMRSNGDVSAEELQQYRESISRTRARAKNAIEVARSISEAGTAEEERRLLREQMEAQIKAGFGGASLRRSSMVAAPLH